MASQEGVCVAYGLHSCFQERQLLVLQLLVCTVDECFGLESTVLLKLGKCLKDNLEVVARPTGGQSTQLVQLHLTYDV